MTEDDKTREDWEGIPDLGAAEDKPPKELSPTEIKELLRRYRKDYLFFAPKVLKVQTMQGRMVPFVLNGPQLIVHVIIEKIRASGRLVRIIGLKARRMGFSTYFSGRFYHLTSWHRNRYASQVTHEPEATDTLFKMIKRFYNCTPKWLRPSTLYNNTSLLEFNRKDGQGLNSGFRVATAEKKDYGSGQLIHYCHLSEVSKWPNPKDTDSLLTSILQCVPDEPETEVVFESTAKGIGGAFYDRFWAARYRYWVERLDKDGNPVIKETINENADPSNIYTSIFLPWFVFDLYKAQVPPDFKLIPSDKPEECEVTIKKFYGLSDEQIYWRRLTIANKCNGSVETFNQEYPSNPMHAFLGTGRPVFDNAKLLKLRDAAPIPVARYECLTGMGQWITRPTDGRLRVWKEPKRGRFYVIGADVAEGLVHGDFSSADVIDHVTGEQVAQWHGHIDADQFGMVLYYLGKRYNDAWIGVERNNHGLTALTILVNMGYRNLYAEMVPEPPGKPRKRYGWLTSNATRPLIIDNLIMEVREDSHGIKSRDTFQEMMSFKRQDNGKMEADPGQCDDRVMSYAIAKHLRLVTPIPKIGRPGYWKNRNKRPEKGKHLPSAAWT